MALRNRYTLRITIEVPADTLPRAIERAMRLFRPRVRSQMRVGATYAGSYRGSWFMMERVHKPPVDRIDLGAAKRNKKLRRRRKRS